MNASSDYYAWACRLHEQIPVVDAHNDLAGELLIRHQNGETNVIKRLYLPDWKQAGFHLIVSSVYVESTRFFPSDAFTDTGKPAVSKPNWNDYLTKQALCWDNGYADALAQIQALKNEIESLPEVCLVTGCHEWEAVMAKQKIGILLYMEGLDCIGDDVSKLYHLYQLGVRGASLTWSRKNLLATGCCTATEKVDIPGPITSLGWQVVELLQKLSMFLDISHLNNEGWEQINAWYTAKKPPIPYVATHSNSYSVFPNYRNLTKRQMKALAGQGGIMGLNACKYLVGAEDANEYLNRMYEHINDMLRQIGETHIGYGFDLCDSYERGKHPEAVLYKEDCLNNHREALLLTAYLLEQGVSEQTVLRIIGLNWLEYFRFLLSAAF